MAADSGVIPPPPPGFVLAGDNIPPPPAGFVMERRKAPRTASGVLDALQAGYQGGGTGLAIRGQLPDVVLDPSHSKWYEKLAAGVAQIGSELPQTIVGAVAGGATGTAAGPVGTILGTGAGSMAVPAAIRSSLIEAYKSGTAQSSGGFLNSAKIVIKDTLKEGLIGGATFGVGAKVARTVGSAIAPSIGQTMSVGTAAKAIGAAQTTAEIGTMVVAGSALEGKLPEWEDFLNAAVMIGGIKASVGVAQRIGKIYAETGKTPAEVVADAKKDPTIALDLKSVEPATGQGIQAYHGSAKIFSEFDTAKIGEGEGAQAFGYGLYVAESPSVASAYKRAGVAGDNVVNGELVRNLNLSGPESQANNMFANRLAAKLSVEQAKAQTIEWLRKGSQWSNDPAALAKAEAFIAKVEPPPAGNLYKVEITAPRERFVEWDKTVSEQSPEVQAALRSPEVLQRLNEVRQELGLDAWKEVPDVGVEGLLKQMGATEGGARAQQVSELLASKGLAGIRYLDGNSRKAGEGTANYVVFDHNNLRVTERNGQPTVPRAYQPLAAEENARNAIADPAAAKSFVDKPFAEVPQAPGTPKVKLHVNYDYITSPDDAKAALARATELYGDKIIEQTRGKVSWEQTEKQAKQDLADMIGQADFTLLDARTPGTAANATELLLRKQMMEGAVEDFTRRARAYDAAKSSPEEAVQMLAAGERVAMLSAQFQGAASEAGRALNILKNARDSARSAEEVQKLLDLYGTDPATLAKIMQGVDNPVAAAKAARELVKATRWDKFVEAYKAILISGPISQVANVVGNATFLPLRPVIDATAATLGAIRGSPDRVRAIEPVVRITGYWQGMVDALRSGNEWIKLYGDKPFMDGLRDLDANLGARKAEVKKRAIEGDLGVLARSPFLTLSIPDQLFRLMHERGEANTLAARRAIKEGYTVGSQEFAERMAHHLNNPDTAMMQEIRAMGDRGTFNADMGKIGTAAQTLIRESKTEWLFPFVRTPANVVKELIRMTPGAPIIDTWRADIAKGGAAAEKAIAEAMVGSLMMSFFVGMAQGGKITGAGEPDPGKKRVDLAAGKQPYSFMASDGKMYDFQRLQPVGTLVGIAADMSEVWDRMTPEERDKVPKMVSVAFANAVTNQTMLMGVTNLVKAMSDPDQFGARFVQNTVAGLVPGAVGQTAQLNDPYMREIYSVLDAVKNRVPGTREDLQPKIDVWGRPVENRDRVGGIGPSRIMEVSKDPVVSEASRLGVSVPAAPKDIILPAGGDRKLGKVELTPEQRTTFSTVAGQVAYNVLTPIVNSPGWASTPDMIKKRTYEVAFERARAAARAAALPIEQREIESGRIMDVINQRLSP